MPDSRRGGRRAAVLWATGHQKTTLQKQLDMSKWTESGRSRSGKLTITVEHEGLVDLHVTRLEFNGVSHSKLFFDFGLVEVSLDPTHFFVAQRTTIHKRGILVNTSGGAESMV